MSKVMAAFGVLFIMAFSFGLLCLPSLHGVAHQQRGQHVLGNHGARKSALR